MLCGRYFTDGLSLGLQAVLGLPTALNQPRDLNAIFKGIWFSITRLPAPLPWRSPVPHQKKRWDRGKADHLPTYKWLRTVKRQLPSTQFVWPQSKGSATPSSSLQRGQSQMSSSSSPGKLPSNRICTTPLLIKKDATHISLFFTTNLNNRTIGNPEF